MSENQDLRIPGGDETITRDELEKALLVIRGIEVSEAGHVEYPDLTADEICRLAGEHREARAGKADALKNRALVLAAEYRTIRQEIPADRRAEAGRTFRMALKGDELAQVLLEVVGVDLGRD